MNKVFHIVYLNYKDDSPRFIRERVRYSKRSWKATSKPRTDEIELENREILAAFKAAAKTLPQGCRKDPVPWWDESLDFLISERDRLRNEISGPASPGTVAEKRGQWSIMNRLVKDTIFKLRKSHWEEFCSTKCNYGSDPKATAAIINHLSRDTRPSRAGIISDTNGKEYASDKEKARAFKNMFAKVCMKPKKQKRPGHTMQDRRIARKDRDFAERELNTEIMTLVGDIPHVEYRAAIAQLCLGKAYGKDGISNEMMVNLSRLNSDRLRNLVNASLQSEKVPVSWKFGILFPLPKAGKYSIMLELYRSISLLSCVGKLADRIISNRFIFHTESHGILCGSQAGFIKFRGTEDVGMELVCDIHKSRAISWEQKREGGGTSDHIVVPIDFEKAFDKMNHAKLIKICRMNGIPGNLARWYWAYMRQRRYCVRVGADFSRSCAFNTGAAQGSISGPLLFNQYTTTLSEELSEHAEVGVKHGAYADDFQIWMKFKNETHYTQVERLEILEILRPLQASLNTVDRWTQLWGMPLSKTKSGEAILFWANYERQSTKDLELYLGGKILLKRLNSSVSR